MKLWGQGIKSLFLHLFVFALFSLGSNNLYLPLSNEAFAGGGGSGGGGSKEKKEKKKKKKCKKAKIICAIVPIPPACAAAKKKCKKDTQQEQKKEEERKNLDYGAANAEKIVKIDEISSQIGDIRDESETLSEDLEAIYLALLADSQNPCLTQAQFDDAKLLKLKAADDAISEFMESVALEGSSLIVSTDSNANLDAVKAYLAELIAALDAQYNGTNFTNNQTIVDTWKSDAATYKSEAEAFLSAAKVKLAQIKAVTRNVVGTCSNSSSSSSPVGTNSNTFTIDEDE